MALMVSSLPYCNVRARNTFLASSRKRDEGATSVAHLSRLPTLRGCGRPDAAARLTPGGDAGFLSSRVGCEGFLAWAASGHEHHHACATGRGDLCPGRPLPERE